MGLYERGPRISTEPTNLLLDNGPKSAMQQESESIIEPNTVTLSHAMPFTDQGEWQDETHQYLGFTFSSNKNKTVRYAVGQVRGPKQITGLKRKAPSPRRSKRERRPTGAMIAHVLSKKSPAKKIKFTGGQEEEALFTPLTPLYQSDVLAESSGLSCSCQNQ